MQIIPFKREDYQFSNNMPDDDKDLQYDLMNISHRTTVVAPLEQKKLAFNRMPKDYNA